MGPAGMEKAMCPVGMEAGKSLLVPKKCQQMRTPGVEPRSQAWEACMMPLHYMRLNTEAWANIPVMKDYGWYEIVACQQTQCRPGDNGGDMRS